MDIVVKGALLSQPCLYIVGLECPKVCFPLIYILTHSHIPGSDILGHPMIVEPSHQQRLSSRYETI